MKKLLGLLLIGTSLLDAGQSLLFIDTGANNAYTFNDLMLMSTSVGFQPTFKEFYNVTPKELDQYGTIVLNIDINIVAALLKKEKEQPNPLLTHFTTLIKAISALTNKTIVILAPSGSNSKILTTYMNKLLGQLIPAHAHQKELNDFLGFLLQPDNKKSTHYHTSLLTKKDPAAKLTFQAAPIIKDSSYQAAALPQHAKQPFAFYLHAGTNHYFVSKTSLLNFAGIQENFMYTPIDSFPRKYKLREVVQVIQDIYTTAATGSLTTLAKLPNKLPYGLSNAFAESIQKQASEIRQISTSPTCDMLEKENIWIGWAEMWPYSKQPTQATKSLLASGLNILWFELNPECILGKHAKNPDQKDKLLEQIDVFTRELVHHAKISKKRPPRFFMGTDITTNYHKKKIETAAIDAFGRVFTKIPAPLDIAHFWQEEFIEVFDAFLAEWPSINNGLPLGGVFLDLEMYHAQDQTGQFTNFMDFSDTAWKYFVRQHPQAASYTTHHERISYLFDHKLLDDYFDTLYKAAYALGTKLRKHIKSKLPHGLIALYNLHPPTNWFYRGLLAGLSTPEEPIILATFNTEFYKHYPWLIEQDIQAYHVPVILLSKFHDADSFKLIGEQKNLHDGVWFNKISRLEESRDAKDWSHDYSVEVSPLPTYQVVGGMHKEIDKAQHR